MKKFWIDFSASIQIEAEDEAEAKKKAYEEMPSEFKFVDIDNVEEIKD